jgi:hypothetical protein
VTSISRVYGRVVGTALGALALAQWSAAVPALAQQGETVIAQQAAADRDAAASQARIDQLQDATSEMLGKYRQALLDAESIKRYNEQLAQQVQSQEGTLAGMRKQLSEIETTQRDVLPLMQEMVDTLEQFVALDVPFLPDERARRILTLKGLLQRAEVSTSEKYRRIMEAYQIEMDYGRTLDAYEGTLEAGGAQRTVQFVRLGRVALLYQTNDALETGYWDTAAKSWVRDDNYSQDVREALRIAKKQGAPDLIMVPLPAPKEIGS